MKIKFLNGSLEGKAHQFDGPLVTFGRAETNILMLNDPGVSSRHAFMEKVDGKWFIFDNESTNGVLINGKKIEKKGELHDEDTIRFGTVDFVIVEGGLPPRAKKEEDNTKAANIGGVKVGDSKTDDKAKDEEKKSVSIGGVKVAESKTDDKKGVSIGGVKVGDSKTDDKAKGEEKSSDSKSDDKAKDEKPKTEEKNSEKSSGDKKSTKVVFNTATKGGVTTSATHLSAEAKAEALEKQEELREKRREARKKKKLQNQIIMGSVAAVVLLLLYLIVPGMIDAAKAKQTANNTPAKAEDPKITVKDKDKKSSRKSTKSTPAQTALPTNFPLYVQSYPTEATIEIDGKVIGTTPMELAKFKSGVHTLTIYKEGFKPTEYVFSHPDSPIQIHTLEQEDYTAMVTSTPTGAAITVGGQLRGHTPFILRELKTGNTKIHLTAHGFEPQTSIVTLDSEGSRAYVHMKLKDFRGSVQVLTKPPGCKVLINGDLLGMSEPANADGIISKPLTLENILPGEYELTVSSPDGSEKKTEKIIVKGGEVTKKGLQITMVNTLLKLNDDTEVYGMIVSKNAKEIKFQAKKVGDQLFETWQDKTYPATEVASITPTSMKKMLGFTEGIELRSDRFKPILASIHDEFDETDYKEMMGDAKSAGKVTSNQISGDYKSLDLFAMQEKYMNKKLTVSGSVSMVREGEKMYSIVFEDRVECYIPKDDNPDIKDKLVKLKGGNATVSGFCLGIRGLDRIVLVESSLK